MRNENEKIFLRCNPIKTVWKDSVSTPHLSVPPSYSYTFLADIRITGSSRFFTVNIGEFSNSVITINFKMFLQYFITNATSSLLRITTKVIL